MSKDKVVDPYDEVATRLGKAIAEVNKILWEAVEISHMRVSILASDAEGTQEGHIWKPEVPGQLGIVISRVTHTVRAHDSAKDYKFIIRWAGDPEANEQEA